MRTTTFFSTIIGKEAVIKGKRSKQNSKRGKYNEMKKQLILLVVFALSLLMSTSVSAQTVIGNQTITGQLMELESFVSTRRIGQVDFQELDYDRAIKAGFSSSTLDLAAEMIAFQNEYKLSITNGETFDDISLHSPTLTKYPLITKFFNEINGKENQIEIQNLITAAPTACGNWDYPVPNYTPYRANFYGYSNPRQTLINWGYHLTAGYACGQDPFVLCSNDYTWGRSYSGPYGSCSSPRFRNQGNVVSSNVFSIQYGEPNPEVLSYSWPYWNWGVYVRYWHATY